MTTSAGKCVHHSWVIFNGTKVCTVCRTEEYVPPQPAIDPMAEVNHRLFHIEGLLIEILQIMKE